MKTLTYMDFAIDEWQYLNMAYMSGIYSNAQIAQCQRIAEGALKHIIDTRFLNQNEVMMSHSLRHIYDAIIEMGIDIRSIRSDIMILNNYHTHTRYPGRDAFLADFEDIKASVEAVNRILEVVKEVI